MSYTTINQIFCTNQQTCQVFKYVMQINWFTIAYFQVVHCNDQVRGWITRK
jgi:hypothetical protein